MPARPPFAFLAVLAPLAFWSGCGPCGRVFSLDNDKCLYANTAATSGESSSTSMSTESTTQDSSTSTGTMSGSSSESGSETASSSGSTTTTDGVCGDGMLDPQEACDDGNLEPGDGCEDDCTVTPSVCGDGKVEGTEECDDGNSIDTDACIDCVSAKCGDEHVRAGVEECDAGAQNSDSAYGPDSCNTKCLPGLRCGDGMVNGPEDCDDMNQADDDDCSNDCVAPRYVFVTAGTYSGGVVDSLTNADKVICKTAGDSITPDATWIAWLSDGSTSASMRLDTDFKGYYRRPDGVVVAKGWNDLSDGALLAPINVSQTGAMVGQPLGAWTGTAPGGTGVDVNMTMLKNCEDWTSNNGAKMGRVGAVDATDTTWTDAYDLGCIAPLRLYCFQN